MEAKLKLAVSEKQAAVAEKATLDKQLRQQTGQKMLIEKNLERKDQMESKKRESIMVVSVAGGTGEGILGLVLVDSRQGLEW